MRSLLKHLKAFSWGASEDGSMTAQHDALNSILDEPEQQAAAASQPEEAQGGDDQQQKLYGKRG